MLSRVALGEPLQAIAQDLGLDMKEMKDNPSIKSRVAQAKAASAKTPTLQ